METRSIDFNQRVGANVRRHREAKGLSQSELSQEMKLLGHKSWVQQTVPRVERGSQPLKLEEACDIAKILDIDLPALTDTFASNETIAASATEIMQIRASIARTREKQRKFEEDMEQWIVQAAQKLRDQEQRLAAAGAFKGDDGNWYWRNDDGSLSTLGGYEELLSR
jgi:transcriptional regulator with XRE-family HTH domain